MDLGISGKTAVVLASSKGMGRAVASALAAEGCNLALAARNTAALEAAAQAIEQRSHVQVLRQPLDVTDAQATQSFIDAVIARFGGIDILINNCGGPRPGGFEQSRDESLWREAFERSLMQVVRWTYAAVPHMKGWGRIVNIVSTSVKEPVPGLLLSNAIRPGVIGFAKSVARELAPRGITINSVLPGSIRTDRTIELANERARREGITVEQALAEKSKEIPVGRLGEPEEIAAVVAFLCSKQAAFITGTTVMVDGGMTRGV